MNKTVTINISGIIFHIDEDAFDKLGQYLSTIKGCFSKTDGGNEIMSDIESRIAEMLQGKTSPIKQVVLMADVEYVIESMGRPEEFGADEHNTHSKNTTSEHTYEAENDYHAPTKKRLYRDTDNKVLGGVCSGIGHYFGFDQVWLRIALALLFFFFGSGFILYIILWIAIPAAKTTAEKLAMKGEKADINNISKAVKEEANHRQAPRNIAEKTVDFITDVILNIGRVLLKITGILMVIFGVIFFLGLFSSVFGISFINTDVEGKEWVDMLLLDGKDFYLGLIGIVIFFGTPIVMMIYGGVKLIFRIKYTNRWLNLSAGIIWLVGFTMLLLVGIRTGQDFSKTAKVRENITVVPNDTLILKLNEVVINYEELQTSDEAKEGEEDFSVSRKHNNYMIGKHNGSNYLLGHARLNIIKSQTDNVELVIVKEAHGRDKQLAKNNAQHISYHVSQQDSLLLFDNIFKVSDADKFRIQDAMVILKLPLGKVIYIDKSMEDFIYDIENVTNTYDGDMVSRRWMMTENGLKCIDCDGLDTNTDKDSDEDEESDSKQKSHSTNGININSKDATIKIDSNGIKINSKDAKLTIDKHGIRKDSKN